jgi:hypothetical protein
MVKQMERYNYLEAMKEDIKEYIRDNYTAEEIAERLEDRGEWETELNDDLWMVDSVTGNASGSYTFSTYKAEEYIAHNLDLLAEALREFGDSTDYLEKGAEACDVTIRCYLLYDAISEALNDIEEDAEQ